MTLNRQTLLLVLMLFFLAGGGFYYFCLLPLKSQTVQLADDFKKEQTLIASLRQADQKNQNEEKVLFPPQFQNEIPEAPYMEQIMLDMTRLQTISGVEMDGIGLANSLETTSNQTNAQASGVSKTSSFPPIGRSAAQAAMVFNGLENVSISTKITGSYTKIHRFFQEVNALPRIIRVDQVKVLAEGGSNLIELRPKDGQQQFTAEVTMEAFFSPKLQPYFPNRLPIVVAPPGDHKSPFE